MKQLSAIELLPIGLGDAQGAYGYLTALDPWMEQLFLKLVGTGAGAGAAPAAATGPRSSDMAPPQYTITARVSSL